jgi:virginiamycin A acetyltransferase
MRRPDPNEKHPIPGWPAAAYLKSVVDHPAITVGDFSYYDDPDGPERFVETCVRYLFDFVGDRLVIGKFVAIAAKAQFVMNGANHDMRGFSTFPFASFGFAGDEDMTANGPPIRGDTVIGHDVWIGREATILPGVRIGDGAIVGACSVVSRNVPPYGVVTGNPARLVKRRFDEATIARILRLAWWDWPVEHVARHRALIAGADIDALERVAP